MHTINFLILFFFSVSSPSDRYSPVTTTKRVVEKRSNYKMYSSYSGSQDNLDGSPYSSLESDRTKRLGSPSKYRNNLHLIKINCTSKLLTVFVLYN